jgi:hypothetical protein
MSREDQNAVTVSLSYGGATRDLGIFDGLTGGEIDSSEKKFNPGGMQGTISLGGKKAVGNVTVKRLYDLIRDHPLMGWIAGGVGRADVTVVKSSMTVDSVAIANPLVYRGKLKTLTPPDHDSESDDAAMWEMEISSATMSQAQ